MNTPASSTAARPSESTRKAELRGAHRRFATEALRASGLTRKALAEAAGFDRTVLSRLFSERYDNVLSPIVIDKICSFTGVAPPTPRAPERAASPGVTGMTKPSRRDLAEAVGFAANDDVDLDAIVRAIVGRRTECDPWQVASDGLATVGLRRGDVVFVDRAVRAADGDLVLAQLYNWDGSWAGTVLRLLDRERLVLPWTGPETPTTIDLRGSPSGGVAVMGPVTQTFRPRRMSRIEPGEA